MNRRRHIVILAMLLGLSCLVQALAIGRSTTVGLDSVRFVGIAQSIDQHGLIATLRCEWEQPLFPAWIWLVQEGLQGALGEFDSLWAVAAQLAASTALVLAVAPVYWLSIRLHSQE